MAEPGTPTTETRGEGASTISNQVVGLVSRYTGRGPTKTRVTINANFVLAVLQDTLTRGEQNLVAAGEVEAVKMMRRTFHDIMRDEAARIVEREVGRKVIAVLGDCDPDANCAAILFLLEPRADTGEGEVAEQ